MSKVLTTDEGVRIGLEGLDRIIDFLTFIDTRFVLGGPLGGPGGFVDSLLGGLSEQDEKLKVLTEWLAETGRDWRFHRYNRYRFSLEDRATWYPMSEWFRQRFPRGALPQDTSVARVKRLIRHRIRD